MMTRKERERERENQTGIAKLSDMQEGGYLFLLPFGLWENEREKKRNCMNIDR
jgi:hypothetical protein